MGMAASQARFLGLTARKTNVEFEGQQVNQQRTSLSNESANYYNDLLGMTVPVPPSVDEYTKTVYTFEDGALTNQITALIAQADGMYTVSYLSHWQDDFAPVAASSSIVTQTAGGYAIGANELRELGTADPNLADNAELQQQKMEEEQAWAALLDEKYGAPAGGWLVRYVSDTSTGKETPFFYKFQRDIEDKRKAQPRQERAQQPEQPGCRADDQFEMLHADECQDGDDYNQQNSFHIPTVQVHSRSSISRETPVTFSIGKFFPQRKCLCAGIT